MFFLHLDVQPEYPSSGLLTNNWFKIPEYTLHLLSSLNDLQPFEAGWAIIAQSELVLPSISNHLQA